MYYNHKNIKFYLIITLSKIEITSHDGKIYNGEFYSNASSRPLNLSYRFNVGSCYFGLIEIAFTSKNDTIVEVNGVVYNDAYCDEYACFAKGIGFIKFSNSCDTLTLIK